MSRASVVIGAGYGDEGKGLVTDYLVDRDNANIVVRFNGGAQAGHTVVTPCGKRHIFSHFGSGTFKGAKTYLSRHFVANPLLYFKEKAKLEAIGMGSPKRLMVDPRVIITTPYDIIINQAVENHRNGGRHGSCGVGFGETIERNTSYVRLGDFNSDMLKIKVQDINRSYSNLSDMFYKLEVIRREWVPGRLNELGIPYTKELQDIVMSNNLMKRFIEDLDTFGNELTIIDTADLKIHGSIVFEGAQGLALDQNQGNFPYVTRSNTGLSNVLEICREAKIDDLEVYYATRAYLTRHGAGPMESELKHKPYKGIFETTNVTNDFQGSFRFGNLDVDALKTRIGNDLQIARNRDVKISPKLAVTCVDQLDYKARFIVNGKLKRVHRDDIAKEITQAVGLPYFLESKGPTRTTIKERLAV